MMGINFKIVRFVKKVFTIVIFLFVLVDFCFIINTFHYGFSVDLQYLFDKLSF